MTQPRRPTLKAHSFLILDSTREVNCLPRQQTPLPTAFNGQIMIVKALTIQKSPISSASECRKLPRRSKSWKICEYGFIQRPRPISNVDSRHNTFFATSYHMVPVVHSGRYLQAYYADKLRRPAMCLQYSIWALAAHGHPKYDSYCDIFYRRARQYIQADEMKVCTDVGCLASLD